MQATDKASPEFEQYASSYDELLDDPLRNRFANGPVHFHWRKWLLINKLLKRARLALGAQRWLDVGCGRGELLQLAGSNFAQATGCDPSAGMLSSNVSFKAIEQPTPVELPFDDRSFDFVTAVCVMHHVHGTDRKLLANEMRRVLSPLGWCCIIEHNPWNPVTRTIVKRCPVDVDAELLTARQTRRLLETSGFVSTYQEYFLYLPERLFRTFGGFERVLSLMPLGGQYAVLARVSP